MSTEVYIHSSFWNLFICLNSSMLNSFTVSHTPWVSKCYFSDQWSAAHGIQVFLRLKSAVIYFLCLQWINMKVILPLHRWLPNKQFARNEGMLVVHCPSKNKHEHSPFTSSPCLPGYQNFNWYLWQQCIYIHMLWNTIAILLLDFWSYGPFHRKTFWHHFWFGWSRYCVMLTQCHTVITYWDNR